MRQTIKLKSVGDLALVLVMWGSNRKEFVVTKGLNETETEWDYSLGYYDNLDDANEKYEEVKKAQRY